MNIKTIVCTGDSHTWGQGPDGVLSYFTDPPVCGGELRPAPFRFPCYVNLLREKINSLTGSRSLEREPKIFIESEYECRLQAGLARFFYRFDGDNNIAAEFAFAGDGVTETENAFYTFNDGTPKITPKKPLFLYRAEYYTGAFAVINSGVGSCTTTKYLEKFYDGYVRRCRPFIIAAEAHSINDWINRVPPDMSKENLIKIMRGCTPAKAALLTVADVAGPTALPYNPIDYNEYVEASRSAALEAGTALADANRVINTEGYADNWHPGETGHRIYSEVLFEAVRGFIGL